MERVRTEASNPILQCPNHGENIQCTQCTTPSSHIRAHPTYGSHKWCPLLT